MKRWKSTISILLAVTMLGTILAGCGKSPNGEITDSGTPVGSSGEQTDKQDTNLNELGVYPILKEKEIVTIGVPQNKNVKDYDTNELTLLLEKNGNMDLQFNLFPASFADATQKLQLMISSNQELPELLIGFGSINTSDIYNYGSKGIFLNLSGYFERSSHNIKAGLEQLDAQNIDLLKFAQSSDGNLYGVPRYQEQLGNQFETKTWINKKWLDAVKKPIPTTTDELYEVLKLFATEDPNGNGKKDEVPMAGCQLGWAASVHDFLLNSFTYTDSGIASRGEYRLQVNNGKLDVAYTKDEWKQGLLFMNKLIKENLLTPLTYTQDEAQYKQMLFGSGANGIGVYTRGGVLHANEDPLKDEYVPLAPLKGPQGVQFAPYVVPKPDAYCFITKYAKNPEAIFRLLDYMWSEECTMQSRYGTEGKGWKRAEAGAISGYEDIPAKFEELPLWGTVNNQHWSEQNITFRPRSISDAKVFDPNNLNKEAYIMMAASEYVKYKPEEGTYVPRLIFTEDEMNKLSDIIVTLNSYIEETTARFITDDMDIEKEWNNYLKELEQIGLDKFLEISQVVYDRMYK